MLPFTSLFSSKGKKVDKKKGRSNSISKKEKEFMRIKKQSTMVELNGNEFPRPNKDVGVIGDPVNSGYVGPEEEVFTISLETPPKEKDADRDKTGEWPLLESSFADDELNSTSDYSSFRGKLSPRQRDLDVPKKTLSSYTPDGPKNKLKIRGSNHLKAPKRPSRGRAEQLTRYIHKYDCEDFMEYAVDIYDWKKSLEQDFQPEDWLYTQIEVTPVMRFSLLDWMANVTRTLDFSLETWCLAVNYLDRFLSKQLIGKDCLQLVGLTALWLGAKQEELFPPTLDQLVALCGDAYSAINFLHMELLLLAKLQFRLAAPTPAYHLHHLIAVEEEKDWSDDLSRHMVEIILEDHVLAREKPSKIAHAVYEAIKSFDLSAVQILESSCPKCEPNNADMWCEELFQMCLQRVLEVLTY